jgi:hypothetical protein
MIMDKYYDETIFNNYMDKYIDVRYYNLEPWVRKDFSAHVTCYLNKVYEKDNSDTSKFILGLFKKYYYLDGVLEFDYKKDLDSYVNMINRIRIEKLGINDTEFVKQFSDLVMNNINKKLEFIDNFNNSDFFLDISKINNKNIYNVNINHKVSVPKIFSDYAINKVWNNKIITENKLQVEYYLVNQIILKDIINGKFEFEYFVNIAVSLFEKTDKLKKILNILDNDMAKDSITIKVYYEDFMKYKEIIFSYIKEGYKFAIILDDSYLDDKSNKTILDIFKYIIVTDDKYVTSRIKDLNNVIVLE